MKPPVYLARGSYRRRRIMDAARLLPFVGVFLFALPMLWGSEESPGATTAREGLYLFAVWAGLILAAGVLARFLAAGLEEGRSGEEPGEGGG